VAVTPVFYHPIYGTSLHPEARFPRERYWMVQDEWTRRGHMVQHPPSLSPRADADDLLLVHTADWVGRFLAGQLTESEIRRIGFRPWTEFFVERTLTITGGTIAAMHLIGGGAAVAGNMAGGTHHAFAGHGEGYCVFNDLAIAARIARRDYGFQRILILDLDVHQGNGTADIFAHDPDTFTLSVHGARNYPFRKPPGDLDVELPDQLGDDAFMTALHQHLPGVFRQFHPELVLYQAGVDGLATDRLGRLALTRAGLRRRNELVMDLCTSWQTPVLVTMGGGYSIPIEESVAAHCDVFEQALGLA
jgi:acetoin utilization deacetylase AcuC-like enzyme